MIPLRINIPGTMRGKGRPKFSTRGGFSRAYTDAKTVSAENWVKACAIEQAGNPVLQGPLSVSIEIAVGIPESWSKKKRAAALSGEILPTGKPDFDNTTKLICDALNGIIWKDDAQITDARFSKRYAEAPGTSVTVGAAGQAGVPEPLEYADPERVRAWASQFHVPVSADISFDDIARVNMKRLEYGRPPFVLRTTP